MDAGSRAFVVHLTSQRIRVKIPLWRHQDDNFTALRRALERHPDVVCVRVNAVAACIAIHCRDGFEIASIRNCFAGLEFVLPPSGSAAARQIAPAQRIRDGESRLVGLFIRLLFAIATRRPEVLLRELILEAAVQLFVRQLHRKLEAPGAPLVAAAE